MEKKGLFPQSIFSMVLAKLLASGRSQDCYDRASSGLHLVNASGVHKGFPELVVETIPFQLELGRDLFSVNLEDIGPSP